LDSQFSGPFLPAETTQPLIGVQETPRKTALKGLPCFGEDVRYSPLDI
jgi:hypothetical protein